ncbi:hypothetical protein QR680_013179 [Steinernema hermaphroditum]|uniref:Prospero domain-containing protein n=1 Tax=Steinernema hermaphroditum TaxID=289476 RepID=A0AA39M149_9BILA|nr:hypothetical protein QR680_013179 [Steinernema hermaphroditum]
MPSGGAVPPPVVPFGHQFPLFAPHHFVGSPSQPGLAPSGPHTSLLPPPPNRIKVKRSRQRVDAGEPRNSYQSPFRAHRAVFKPQTPSSASSVVSSAASGVESCFMFGTLTSMLGAENGGWQKPEKMITQEEPPPEQEHCSDDASFEHAETEAPATATAEIDELQSVDLNVEDGDDDEGPAEGDEESSANTSTPSAGSSSSRRKSFFPQKQPASDDAKEEDDEELLEDDEKGVEEPEDLSENKVEVPPTSAAEMSKLQELAAESQRRLFSTLLEQQKKQLGSPEFVQVSVLGRQRLMAMQEKGRVLSQLQQTQTQQIQKDFGRYAQTLKQELLSQFSGCIDKIFAELASHEAAANNARIAAAVAATANPAPLPSPASQMPELAAQLRLPFMMHPAMYGGAGGPYGGAPAPGAFGNGTAAPGGLLGNPMVPTSAASGIFPSHSSGTAFNPFNSSLAALSASLRKNDISRMSYSPYSVPKKKRSKVTDSVRIKSGSVRDTGSSLPASARSSPQLAAYFPPTMVGQSLYGASGFGQEDNDESPMNSDDNSDCGPYDGGAQSSTLTPMHLRKAKLMFFYARYPSSSVLKSYFPDIRFHKNNTAQLVKWFSNFSGPYGRQGRPQKAIATQWGTVFLGYCNPRDNQAVEAAAAGDYGEFYYIQMDKFARQALAEGVRDKDEIVVTPDSEIYKLLNQHYNRNNHIQPPDSLAGVIQKTLQEFFVAIQNGRDAEPSWKKAIYKVINQLDEQIPEYFKNPTFLENLES